MKEQYLKFNTNSYFYKHHKKCHLFYNYSPYFFRFCSITDPFCLYSLLSLSQPLSLTHTLFAHFHFLLLWFPRNLHGNNRCTINVGQARESERAFDVPVEWPPLSGLHSASAFFLKHVSYLIIKILAINNMMMMAAICQK